MTLELSLLFKQIDLLNIAHICSIQLTQGLLGKSDIKINVTKDYVMFLASHTSVFFFARIDKFIFECDKSLQRQIQTRLVIGYD